MQYPSSSSSRPGISPTPTMERPQNGSTRTNTSIHLPSISYDHAAGGEPLVEDFQMRYMPQEPRSPGTESLPGIMAMPDEPTPFFDSGFADYEAEGALPPPDLTRRHAPSRTSSNAKVPRRRLADLNPGSTYSIPNTPESHDRPARSSGSVTSMLSHETAASSIHTQYLPPLQQKGLLDESDRLDPVLEDDPANFDLLAAPPEQVTGIYQLEKRVEQLQSQAHLRLIFSDPRLLLRFTGFLNSHRPQSIPILIYYLDALKALRAITYANAIAEALEPLQDYSFTTSVPKPTLNDALREKANQAFDVLVREDLPAYIAYTWIQVVSVSIQRRITGTLAPHLREASEGLAEVFCLSDPSRPDNPIVFVSEEFARTTQYGMSYSIGRNCRFLQGPRTNPHSVRRLAEACKAQREHSEVFTNYRRDGSPFLNLLMIAPLFDSRGILRYYIGAQVDVSGLVKDCTDLEGYERLVARADNPAMADREDRENHKDEFQCLTEMFNVSELDTVRKCGGRMHRDQLDDDDASSTHSVKPRLLLQDPSSDLLDKRTMSMQPGSATKESARLNGRLSGVYQHYLLVRPAPSLRILFTSPTLRVPGILQSPFLSRIGGSARVRTDLAQALGEGRGVTAKIRWLTRADDDGEGEGRSRWIHCTPLLGHTGAVGVWMVVLVDEESGIAPGEGRRRFRPAPPVANSIGGKDFDAASVREQPRRDAPLINTLPQMQQYMGGSLEPLANDRARGDASTGGYFSTASPQPGAQSAAAKARAPTAHILQQDKSRPMSSMSGRGANRSVSTRSEVSFALH